MLLVLPEDGQESDVRENTSSDADEGREIRKGQIETTPGYLRFRNLRIEFLNVRDDADWTNVRSMLLAAVYRVRAQYEDQIKTLISTIDGLIRNKADEQAKAVFRAAARPMRVWFENNFWVCTKAKRLPT